MDELPAVSAFQTCEKCGQEKPLNSHYWKAIVPSHRGKYAGNPTYYPKCRSCWRAEVAEKRIALKEQTEKENVIKQLLWLEKLRGKKLAIIKRAVTGGQAGVPHIAEVVEAIMSMFGGPMGLAESMISDYMAAKEGSIQRIQLHKIIQSYIAKVSEMGAAKMPVEMMSSDELAKAAEEHEKMRLRILVQNGTLNEVIDAPVEANRAATG